MHKIDGPGATADNEFTEGNPNVGIPATTVTDDWLNTVQRELVNIVQAAGIDLDKADDAQVLAALNALIATAGNAYVPKSAFDGALELNGFQPIPSGLLMQWGRVTSSATSGSVSFRTAFPNACAFLGLEDWEAGPSSKNLRADVPTTTGFSWSSASAPQTFGWFALGY